MRSDNNLNLSSLFISLMNLCEHKYRNSTRVKKRSFIVILVWSSEALCRIYCILSLNIYNFLSLHTSSFLPYVFLPFSPSLLLSTHRNAIATWKYWNLNSCLKSFDPSLLWPESNFSNRFLCRGWVSVWRIGVRHCIPRELIVSDTFIPDLLLDFTKSCKSKDKTRPFTHSSAHRILFGLRIKPNHKANDYCF